MTDESQVWGKNKKDDQIPNSYRGMLGSTGGAQLSEAQHLKLDVKAAMVIESNVYISIILADTLH